ncbi:MAG: hypothetical protein ACTHWA_06585 [Arachnia sp.]
MTISPKGFLPLSRRNVLQFMAAGAGVGALSACSSSDSDTTSASTSTAGATTAAAAMDFSFASWSISEEAAKPVITSQLETFGAEKGISIAPVSYPFNEYLNQLTLQVRGDQFSGAMQLDIAWLATLAALGKLKDLAPMAEGRGYTEAGLSVGQFDGVQVGLPWTMGAIGLIANAELLAKVGADSIPSDIEGFEALLRELKGLDDGTIPYAASTKVAQLKDVQVWMQTFGCSLVEDGEVTIGDDASIEAVTWYKKLYDDGLIGADIDRFDARSLFSQGKAAIYDDAPVGRAGIVADSPDPDLASKLLPGARPVKDSGDTPRALAWGHVVAVVEGDAADTAAEFAQWLTSDEETVVAYFDSLGLPPTTEAGLAADSVASDAFIAAFTEKITATATPSPFWAFPQYGQIDAAISEQVQAVLVGQSSPADAMAAAKEQAMNLIG